MITKINGRVVTEEEFAEFSKRRESLLKAAGRGLLDDGPLCLQVLGEDGSGGYMRGKKNSEDLGAMAEPFRRRALAAAKKAGVSLQGKRHICQLGPPEDPRSWVESYDDFVDKAAAKNLNVEPSNSHRKKHVASPPSAPPKRLRLSAKHTERMIARELAMDPGLADRKDRGELVEMVTEKYGGSGK